MSQLVLYAIAGCAGGLVYHYFTKYALRWAGKNAEYARGVVRGLSHDGFLTFYRAVTAEAERRGVQPTAEEVGRPSRSTEASD